MQSDAVITRVSKTPFLMYDFIYHHSHHEQKLTFVWYLALLRLSRYWKYVVYKLLVRIQRDETLKARHHKPETHGSKDNVLEQEKYVGEVNVRLAIDECDDCFGRHLKYCLWFYMMFRIWLWIDITQ